MRIAILIAILLVGFALRIYRIDQSPFRGDEATTVQYWSRQPLHQTVDQFLTLDPQPLLAYAAYRWWALVAGYGEFITRALPALVSVIGIAAAYALGKRVFHAHSAGIFSATLWSVHPFLVWHAQDARNYALWSAVSIVALWLCVRALEENRRTDWMAAILLSVLAGYLYYLQLFVLVALSLYVLVAYWLDWQTYLRWTGAMLATGAALAPWYLQERLLSGGGYGGTTSGFVAEKFFIDFPVWLNFGSTAPSGVWLAGLAMTGMIAGLWATFRQQPKAGLLLGLVGCIPPLLLVIVTLRLNVLAPRYILAAVPAYVLMITGLVIWLWQQGNIGRGLAVFAVAGWTGIYATSLTTYYNSTKAPDWPALTTYLAEHVREDDLVVQAAADAAFGLYYNVIDTVPADERALPAEPDQPVDEIHRELIAASEAYDSIWIVAQGFTDWPNYGVVDTWLDDNMQRVRDTSTAGLRIQQYMMRDVPDIAGAPLATYNETADLIQLEVVSEAEPTGEMLVWAYWQAHSQTDSPKKVFVQMIGPVNPASGTPVWTQDDRDLPTTTWETGKTYREVYTLPNIDTLPAGQGYALYIGLYDAETGERVPLQGGGDAYIIADALTESVD